MPKAVIFDVDGTLIDSVDLHARAWVDAFHDFGYEISFEDARRQIGKGGDQLLPVFLSKDEIEEKGAALDEHRGNVFKERYLSQIAAFPDVRALFKRLTDDGIRIALASSAKEEDLRTYKRIAGIEGLLHAETSSDDADKSKPHPDIFQAAIRQLDGCAPSDIIAIGDTPYDAEAAAKAGLRTIGFLCGGWSESELRQAGCIAIYQNPAELLKHYDKSPIATGNSFGGISDA